MVARPRGLNLLEKLEFYGWTVDGDGCWIWNGRLEDDGYARIRVNSKSTPVHRIAYKVWIGPIPDEELVRHRCDKRACINPRDLLSGSTQDNMRDRGERGRTASGEHAGLAKVTNAEALDIRTEYANGVLTQKMSGEAYGITQTTVSKIILGETFKGV